MLSKLRSAGLSASLAFKVQPYDNLHPSGIYDNIEALLWMIEAASKKATAV